MADDADPATTARSAAESSFSPIGPFQHATFRSVWIANLVANVGSLIQAVGASWLMTSIAGTPDMVALVQASTTLPIMLFSLAAGAAADNFDRRRLMLASQIFTLLVSLGLAACVVLDLITPWLLLAFTFLVGCGQALNGPAWQASVGDLVPRRDLPGAITINSAGYNLARSVGPAIGGLIVASLGAGVAFIVNALSNIGIIAVLYRWKPPETPRLLPRETLGSAMAAGLRYVAMSPNLRSIIARSGAFGLGSVAILALLPLVARDHVQGGPFTFGVLLGAFGLGAVASAVASGHWRRWLSTEQLARVAFTAFAVATALAGSSRTIALTIPALFVAGGCWVMALSTFNATVQFSTPRWVVGRALAVYQTVVFGAMALGSWLWGEAAAALSTEHALHFAALALIIGGLVGFRDPLPRLEALNLDPLQRWQEPKVAIDIEPRSGPITISIEYVIAPEDVVTFLNVMAQVRRVRRRDGARHWRLMRDLSDPQRWTEIFDTPTWLDYVRQAQRATQADAAIREQLLALHRGPDRPRVHRLIERQPESATSLHRGYDDKPRMPDH
jgi:MFS family permease